MSPQPPKDAPENAEVIDLMAQLKRSLAGGGAIQVSGVPPTTPNDVLPTDERPAGISPRDWAIAWALEAVKKAEAADVTDGDEIVGTFVWQLMERGFSVVPRTPDGKAVLDAERDGDEDILYSPVGANAPEVEAVGGVAGDRRDVPMGAMAVPEVQRDEAHGGDSPRVVIRTGPMSHEELQGYASASSSEAPRPTEAPKSYDVEGLMRLAYDYAQRFAAWAYSPDGGGERRMALEQANAKLTEALADALRQSPAPQNHEQRLPEVDGAGDLKALYDEHHTRTLAATQSEHDANQIGLYAVFLAGIGHARKHPAPAPTGEAQSLGVQEKENK